MNSKPTWDEYLMSIAFVVAMRSVDPSTKHGCVLVDAEHTILSIGYNSPPRGCMDDMIPITRPEKYKFFVHSEEAAIANAARTGTSLRQSTAYITGMPCEKCFRILINAGVNEIVYGPVGSACVDKDTLEAIALMRMGRTDLIMRSYDPKSGLLQRAADYYRYKVKPPQDTGVLPL